MIEPSAGRAHGTQVRGTGATCDHHHFDLSIRSLGLAFSSDEDRTWPLRADLVTGDGRCLINHSRNCLDRELAYPLTVQAMGEHRQGGVPRRVGVRRPRAG
ncbi:hypothetical protein PV726_36960 [Streptomyces europaeiscabiei]|uniref:hypothetical protein n=1 Tax=Streptomyces europaeiscabiei TaxID=146819 RepID=UPI0029B33554|nr:hypothetical protein [Streptomyces europaeiscabiei]MDX3695812.1 hypothetical protein [Streptomyces europaeiscabiei]